MDTGAAGVNPQILAANTLAHLQSIARSDMQFSDPKLQALRNWLIRSGNLLMKQVSADKIHTSQSTDEIKSETVSKKKQKQETPPPSQTPSPRKHKKVDFKQCATRGVRHVYQPYLREISTPDWAGNLSSGDESETHEIEKIDRIDLHKELEIYESRISSGGDSVHFHPIMARQAKIVDRGLVLSQHEHEKAMRYEAVPIVEKTPCFWPERPWDRPETRMSKGETEQLERKLLEEDEKLKEFCSIQRPNPLVNPKRSQSSTAGPNKTKRIMKTTIVKLDPIYYLTDDSDGTDLDDF